MHDPQLSDYLRPESPNGIPLNKCLGALHRIVSLNGRGRQKVLERCCRLLKDMIAVSPPPKELGLMDFKALEKQLGSQEKEAEPKEPTTEVGCETGPVV